MHQRQPFFQTHPGPERGDFDREHVAELIRHDARQEIGIAMDTAVAFRPVIELQDIPPQLARTHDRFFEKRLVNIFQTMAHDTQGHTRLRVPQAPAEARALFPYHLHQVPRPRIP
jgi:hypothetical protein